MKRQIKYLEKVKSYLESLGYEVNKVSKNYPDLLDVWGINEDGDKEHVEIFLTYICNLGYWASSYSETELHENSDGSLDDRFFSLDIFGDLKPVHQRVLFIDENVISVDFSIRRSI